MKNKLFLLLMLLVALTVVTSCAILAPANETSRVPKFIQSGHVYYIFWQDARSECTVTDINPAGWIKVSCEDTPVYLSGGDPFWANLENIVTISELE